MAESSVIKFEKWDGVKERLHKREVFKKKIREGLKRNILKNINAIKYDTPLPPSQRILKDVGEYTIISIRYGSYPIERLCVEKGKYQPLDILNYLMTQLEEGKYDDIAEKSLRQLRNSITKKRYKRKEPRLCNKVNYEEYNQNDDEDDDDFPSYTLTDKQKNELENFPILKGYVESYIENGGCSDELFCLTDFATFFKRLWNENIDELELFPGWEDDADKYYADPENCSGDNWYANFNSCGSNSRWSVGESYIRSNFSECIDNAIRLAKKYGDIDIHAEKIHLNNSSD